MKICILVNVTGIDFIGLYCFLNKLLNLRRIIKKSLIGITWKAFPLLVITPNGSMNLLIRTLNS